MLYGQQPDGQTWEQVYFVDELRDLKIPLGQINELAGYKPTNVIRGFSVLNLEKSTAILAGLELESERHFPVTSETEFNDACSDSMPDGALDAVGKSRRRKEQGFLRNHLFGKKSIGTCGICGHALPVELLVAAHIKPRSECAEEERRDYEHIVMPMCKLGCDELYERGYLSVSSGGVVATLHSATDSLSNKLANLLGRTIAPLSTSQQTYFDWHLQHRFKG